MIVRILSKGHALGHTSVLFSCEGMDVRDMKDESVRADVSRALRDALCAEFGRFDFPPAARLSGFVRWGSAELEKEAGRVIGFYGFVQFCAVYRPLFIKR